MSSGINQPNDINAPSPTKGDGDKPVVSKMVRCAICGKECNGTQGLIGHIRKHPNRGWKGLYPPPREEVAAGSGPAALVQAPGQSEPTPAAPVEAPQAQAPEPAEPAPPVEAGPPPQGQARLQIPDLNLPPPEDYM